jgi:hypothetical protein
MHAEHPDTTSAVNARSFPRHPGRPIMAADSEQRRSLISHGGTSPPVRQALSRNSSGSPVSTRLVIAGITADEPEHGKVLMPRH